jgi:MFS family permease
MLRNFEKSRADFRSFCDGIGATAVIYPAALLTSFALGLANLGIVFFARDVFEASSVQIGWVAGIWSLAYTLSCTLLRPFFSRFPARYLILTSSTLMAIFTLAILFASNLAQVSVCLALYGLSMGMFWPPLMAWLSDGHEGKELGRRFSHYNLMWSVGSVVSPYTCGWLAERSPRYPLLLGAAIFLVTSIFVAGAALVLPKAGNGCFAGGDGGAAVDSAECETPVRFSAWVGLFASFFGFGALLSIFPLAAKAELHIAESTVGLLFLVRALFSALAFYFIGRSIFWHFRVLPMLSGQLLAAGCFVLLCFMGSTLTIGVLFALFGGLMAFSYSYSVFHGVSGCANRIKRMAIHEATLSFGLISGSAVGGMLYSARTMSHVYGMCAVVILLGVAAQALIYLTTRDCSPRA